MNRLFVSFCAVATIFGTACGPDDEASERVVQGGPPVCEGGPRVPTITVEPEVVTTGLNPNVIRSLGSGEFAITESASNTVARFDGQKLTPLVDVGSSRNPYDLDRSDDAVWVSNFISDTVTVAPLDGAAPVELEHSSLEDPAGVARFGQVVVVSNVAFESPTQPYGEGSFTLFDAATRDVVDVLRASARNPIFVRSFESEDGPILVATSSGELFLSSDGAGVGTPGAVEIWRGDSRAPQRSTFDVPQVDDPQIGAPGRPLRAPNGDFYFASGTAPVLFALDPDTGWRHGSDDPLEFGSAEGDALHHADMTDRGVVLVTSFNEDGLYLWDTTCDRPMNEEPIDLGVSSLVEGPHGIVVASESDDTTAAYFIMNLSNVVGRVTLDWR